MSILLRLLIFCSVKKIGVVIFTHEGRTCGESFFTYTKESSGLFMKKLLTSALLTGLLLGTTAPVFAEETTATEGKVDKEASINVSSEIVASYSVTIPSTLNIELDEASNEFSPSTGKVTLTNLSAAGQVKVVVTANDMTLPDGAGILNKTLTTEVSTDAGTSAKTTTFGLTNASKEKTIEVLTTETSDENLPGTYTGSINFTFDYEPAAAE